MKKVTCGGCKIQYNLNDTSFYRRKRWCGNYQCRELIDENVKSLNYRKKQRKIKTGTYRQGVNKELRDKILIRDLYKCSLCEMINSEYGVMQVHHIIPVSSGGEDEETNLICLCRTCHIKVHNEGWESYVFSFKKNVEKLGSNSISFI